MSRVDTMCNLCQDDLTLEELRKLLSLLITMDIQEESGVSPETPLEQSYLTYILGKQPDNYQKKVGKPDYHQHQHTISILPFPRLRLAKSTK